MGVAPPALWACFAVCVTWLVLVADAVAVEVLTCVAPPAGALSAGGALAVACGIQMLISVPSIPEPFGSAAFGSMLTDTFPFVDEVWVDVADAFDVCVVGAFWSRTCDWPADAPPPPVWAWSAPCSTVFELAAPAVAPEVLVWVRRSLVPRALVPDDDVHVRRVDLVRRRGRVRVLCRRRALRRALSLALAGPASSCRLGLRRLLGDVVGVPSGRRRVRRVRLGHRPVVAGTVDPHDDVDVRRGDLVGGCRGARRLVRWSALLSLL